MCSCSKRRTWAAVDKKRPCATVLSALQPPTYHKDLRPGPGMLNSVPGSSTAPHSRCTTRNITCLPTHSFIEGGICGAFAASKSTSAPVVSWLSWFRSSQAAEASGQGWSCLPQHCLCPNCITSSVMTMALRLIQQLHFNPCQSVKVSCDLQGHNAWVHGRHSRKLMT